MEDPRKITFSIVEDSDIVATLDRMAEEEGTSRGAIVRRAIRRLLFSSPIVPTFANISEEENNPIAA